MDGLKVLAAFTDEKALLDWSKRPCPYTSIRSQDVLELCKANGIARIVINNHSSNTFVLEKARRDSKEYEILERDNYPSIVEIYPYNGSNHEALPIGAREHVHLRPGSGLGKSS